jgi:hypothetical protein
VYAAQLFNFFCKNYFHKNRGLLLVKISGASSEDAASSFDSPFTGRPSNICYSILPHDAGSLQVMEQEVLRDHVSANF